MQSQSKTGTLAFERRLIGAICCASLGLLSGAFYLLMLQLHLV